MLERRLRDAAELAERRRGRLRLRARGLLSLQQQPALLLCALPAQELAELRPDRRQGLQEVRVLGKPRRAERLEHADDLAPDEHGEADTGTEALGEGHG